MREMETVKKREMEIGKVRDKETWKNEGYRSR